MENQEDCATYHQEWNLVKTLALCLGGLNMTSGPLKRGGIEDFTLLRTVKLDILQKIS